MESVSSRLNHHPLQQMPPLGLTLDCSLGMLDVLERAFLPHSYDVSKKLLDPRSRDVQLAVHPKQGADYLNSLLLELGNATAIVGGVLAPGPDLPKRPVSVVQVNTSFKLDDVLTAVVEDEAP